MRRHRIIFLAAAACATGCPASTKQIATARQSVYDTDFSVVFSAALDATRDVYPNIDDAPGRGVIKTAWHQVSYANNQDDLANPRTVAQTQGVSANNAAAG